MIDNKTEQDGLNKNDSKNNVRLETEIISERQAARKRVRSGVKNIEGRVRNKTFKIKQLIAVPQNILVKKNDQVV